MHSCIQNIVVYCVLDTAMVLVHTELMVWQEEQTVLKARTKLGKEGKEGRHVSSSGAQSRSPFIREGSVEWQERTSLVSNACYY